MTLNRNESPRPSPDVAFPHPAEDKAAGLQPQSVGAPCDPDLHIPRILRLPEVRISTGYSRSTIYLRISQGLWPRPVSLGPRSVGWPASEIAAVNLARIAGQSDAEIRELVGHLEAGRRGGRR